MSTFDGIHRVISACVAPPMQMSDGQHIAGVFISILPKEAGEPTVLQRPGLPLQPGVSGAGNDPRWTAAICSLLSEILILMMGVVIPA